MIIVLNVVVQVRKLVPNVLQDSFLTRRIVSVLNVPMLTVLHVVLLAKACVPLVKLITTRILNLNPRLASLVTMESIHLRALPLPVNA